MSAGFKPSHLPPAPSYHLIGDFSPIVGVALVLPGLCLGQRHARWRKQIKIVKFQGKPRVHNDHSSLASLLIPEGLLLTMSVCGRTVLPAHGQFLAKHVFGSDFANPFLKPRTIARWLDVAVRYRSQAALGSIVNMGCSNIGLDVARVSRQNQGLRSDYLTMMTGYKNALLDLSKIPPPARRGPLSGANAQLFAKFTASLEWKRLYVQIMANTVGVQIDDPSILDKLFPQLEPAWEFVSTVIKQTLCQGYQFDQNANDVMDEAQLHYLCDPQLVFVTRDNRLRAKVPTFSGSRVISFDELKLKL